jgi:glycosyltransferase involved in cell wall biosynthesis
LVPVVSIIIPSFNDLNNLKKCILSIQNQKYKAYEIIVIDGGSDDETIDYLKSFSHNIFWKSSKDKGIFDAMNKGIHLAKGEWILFLGADDQLYDKDVLKDIFFKKYLYKTKLILGLIKYNITDKDSVWLKRNSGIFKPCWSKKLWIRNTVHHQGIFYKNELLKQNNFNIKYKRLSDYALNIKFYKMGVKTENIDRTIALCGTKGVSKNFDWKLYKEEIDLKVSGSNILYKPLFWLLGSLKYGIKQAENLF